ncbi:MAG: M23 family metallopeptidase [Scytonematopsis contorta HA4267-MV1]|jgi:lysostaphin|nr:M23 family metallopeptidase [Scytonematopsis contorta HA4267-MV1]
MIKGSFSRLLTYSLIALAAFSTVILSANTPVWTQTANYYQVRQGALASSGLMWPTSGTVSRGFIKNQHEGIDIAGPSGTPIIAVAPGTVIKAGWDDWGLGNAVVIRHSEGSVTVYGHNRRLLVAKGQQVNQGQMIAEMGSTGNSTGPHLHFEFQPDGRIPVDPMRTFSSNNIAGRNQRQTQASIRQTEDAFNDDVPPNEMPQRSYGARTNLNLLPMRPPMQQPMRPPMQQPMRPPMQPPMQPPTRPAMQPNYRDSVAANTQCQGATVISGETQKAVVKLCQESGQLFYIGQAKQDFSPIIKLPAWRIGASRFRADNGNYSYFVTPTTVEVWRDGEKVNTDSLNTYNF